MKIETVEQYTEAAMRTKSPHCDLNHVETERLLTLLNMAQAVGGMARDIKRAVYSGKSVDEVPNELSLLGTPIAGMNPDIFHAALGVLNEAGEVAGAMLKFVHGESTDFTNMDEEMGDLDWFRILYCVGRGIPVQQLWERNIAKLAARYPGKFDGGKLDDANRDKAAEDAALRGEQA